MTTEYIVIKIGGVASKQLTPDILAKLSEWQQAGQKIIIVHGGGFAINQLMEEHDITIHKVNSLRGRGQVYYYSDPSGTYISRQDTIDS